MDQDLERRSIPLQNTHGLAESGMIFHLYDAFEIDLIDTKKSNSNDDQ